MIKYLSLFSGIGGFEIGLSNSNYDFECIGSSEVDKYALSIYSRHFPTHKQWGDVTKIRTEELPDFDLLVGGFPCQAFSHAGLRRGFDDTRGTLFFEIARILKDKRPTYFLLENVRGLLHHDEGKTFKTILKVLSDLGYNVKWEVFNSKEFVPQRRERIFIKGCVRERCGREILSFRRADSKTSDTLNNPKIKRVGNFSPTNHYGKDVFSVEGLAPTLCGSSIAKNGLNILEENVNKHFSKVDDDRWITSTKDTDSVYAITTAQRSTPLHKKIDNYVLEKCRGSNRSHATVTDGEETPPLLANTSNIPLLQFKEKPLKIRETTKKGYKEAYPNDGILLNRGSRKIAKGIVRKNHCGALQTSGVWGTVDPNYKIRKLTPVECERLQGFPDDWTKYGVDDELISNTQRYKCIGNAVTVPVITFIINEMFGG